MHISACLCLHMSLLITALFEHRVSLVCRARKTSFGMCARSHALRSVPGADSEDTVDLGVRSLTGAKVISLHVKPRNNANLTHAVNVVRLYRKTGCPTDHSCLSCYASWLQHV